MDNAAAFTMPNLSALDVEKIKAFLEKKASEHHAQAQADKLVVKLTEMKEELLYPKLPKKREPNDLSAAIEAAVLKMKG